MKVLCLWLITASWEQRWAEFNEKTFGRHEWEAVERLLSSVTYRAQEHEPQWDRAGADPNPNDHPTLYHIMQAFLATMFLLPLVL